MLSASNSTPATKQYSLQSKWNLLFDKSPEWIAFKPQLGLTCYPCYACKNLFGSKLTFQDHVNRRVIVIKYKCTDCSTNFTFYNRCSFLLHTRKHYNGKEGVVDLANVEISILPVDLAGFTRHEGIPYLYDEEDVFTEHVNSQFYTPDDSEAGKQVITLKPFNLIFTPADKNFYMVLKQVSSNVPRCEFVLQNEAGTPCQEVKKEHPIAKDNVCAECLQIPKNGIAEHFLGQNKPLDENLCCLVCKYIAPSKCSHNAHVRSHRGLPPFICPECGANCDTSSSLADHMNDTCYHMQKQVRYRCPGSKCGKLFVMANTYASHLYNHFQCVNRCSVCYACFSHEPDFVQHKSIHDCRGIKSFNCMLCKDHPTFAEDKCTQHVNYHMRDRDNCVYVFSCKLCRSSFRSSTTFSVHKKRCSNRSDVATLCANCKQVVTFNGEATKACPNCKHMNRCPKTLPSDPKKILCVLCKEEVSPEEKSIHRTLCKYTNPVVNISLLSDEEEEIEEEEDIQDPPAKKARGLFMCKICKIQYNDRVLFHGHIIGHRDVSTAYQCMECGECFVVKPSLIKHLVHFHQIKNTNRYFEENNCFDKGAVEELRRCVSTGRKQATDVKENQCSVCLEQFDDTNSLNKHFRVHGMAFLLQKTK